MKIGIYENRFTYAKNISIIYKLHMWKFHQTKRIFQVMKRAVRKRNDSEENASRSNNRPLRLYYYYDLLSRFGLNFRSNGKLLREE